MIRGHIEVVTPDMVQGWICNLDGKTRDHVVLAFSGGDCVGSGRVEVFRKDLAEAGLGDGYLGFSFPISLDKQSPDSVTVRLDGSDAVLLQANATVNCRAGRPTLMSRVDLEKQMVAIKWQLEHARLSQGEYDFLRILATFGVYERSLLRRDEVGQSAVAQPAGSIATALLDSYLATDAHVIVNDAVTASDFTAELNKIATDPELTPVVAIYTSDRVVIRAVEGSHLEQLDGAIKPQSIDYKLTSKNLIIIDSRIQAELIAPPKSTLSLVTATLAPF